MGMRDGVVGGDVDIQAFVGKWGKTVGESAYVVRPSKSQHTLSDRRRVSIRCQTVEESAYVQSKSQHTVVAVEESAYVVRPSKSQHTLSDRRDRRCQIESQQRCQTVEESDRPVGESAYVVRPSKSGRDDRQKSKFEESHVFPPSKSQHTLSGPSKSQPYRCQTVESQHTFVHRPVVRPSKSQHTLSGRRRVSIRCQTVGESAYVVRPSKSQHTLSEQSRVDTCPDRRRVSITLSDRRKATTLSGCRRSQHNSLSDLEESAYTATPSSATCSRKGRNSPPQRQRAIRPGPKAYNPQPPEKGSSPTLASPAASGGWGRVVRLGGDLRLEGEVKDLSSLPLIVSSHSLSPSSLSSPPSSPPFISSIHPFLPLSSLFLFSFTLSLFSFPPSPFLFVPFRLFSFTLSLSLPLCPFSSFLIHSLPLPLSSSSIFTPFHLFPFSLFPSYPFAEDHLRNLPSSFSSLLPAFPPIRFTHSLHYFSSLLPLLPFLLPSPPLHYLIPSLLPSPPFTPTFFIPCLFPPFLLPFRSLPFTSDSLPPFLPSPSYLFASLPSFLLSPFSPPSLPAPSLLSPQTLSSPSLPYCLLPFPLTQTPSLLPPFPSPSLTPSIPFPCPSLSDLPSPLRPSLCIAIHDDALIT
ncbi:hypothetical protein C7M84_003062 [Penaeus vannamei]|uniref:Uncharacterized protein n=1 Tax=Penaeus vannamei TaxID=6689 RepID=A0A3R7PVG9_PENVA|nr:hypothetical protein C7M84_003062 [Penaeus vannamei]